MQRRHFNFGLVSMLGCAATGSPISRAVAAEKSSLLRFSMADGTTDVVFTAALERYFAGKFDRDTLDQL